MTVRWRGSLPTTCQVCQEPLKGFFIDGYTHSHGRWGIMCVACHKQFGTGLGTGRGQKFDMTTLEKVEA
jgi:hypothetical protein